MFIYRDNMRNFQKSVATHEYMSCLSILLGKSLFFLVLLYFSTWKVSFFTSNNIFHIITSQFFSLSRCMAHYELKYDYYYYYVTMQNYVNKICVEKPSSFKKILSTTHHYYANWNARTPSSVVPFKIHTYTSWTTLTRLRNPSYHSFSSCSTQKKNIILK